MPIAPPAPDKRRRHRKPTILAQAVTELLVGEVCDFPSVDHTALVNLGSYLGFGLMVLKEWDGPTPVTRVTKLTDFKINRQERVVFIAKHKQMSQDAYREWFLQTYPVRPKRTDKAPEPKAKAKAKPDPLASLDADLFAEL